MVTIIITIIVSTLLGFGTPINFIGLNFPPPIGGSNLFSQISSKLPSASLPNLSEIDPLKSLGNATGPLDDIWKAVAGQLKSLLNSKDTNLPGPLKSSLESGLSGSNTSDTLKGLGMVKSAFILIANIFVAVLEIALWLLRGALGLLS